MVTRRPPYQSEGGGGGWQSIQLIETWGFCSAWGGGASSRWTSIASLKRTVSGSDISACTAGHKDEFCGVRSGSGDLGEAGTGSSEVDSV